MSGRYMCVIRSRNVLMWRNTLAYMSGRHCSAKPVHAPIGLRSIVVAMSLTYSISMLEVTQKSCPS